MNKTLKDKIDSILNTPDTKKYAMDYTDSLLSLFEEMGESLIGEDTNTEQMEENELRSEQRAKLKELVGK